MNRKTETPDLNPWHSRENFPDARELNLLPAAALFALACLSFPLSALRVAPYVLWPLLAVGILYLTRKWKVSAPATLLFTALLLPVPVWGASLGFLLLAASAGAFAGAYLFTVTARPYWPAAISVLAFAVAFAVTRNAVTALLAAAPLPAALLIGIATLRDERRTVAIIYGIAGFLLPLLAAAGWFCAQRGGLRAETILSITGGWKERTVAELTEWYERMLAVLRANEANAGTADRIEQTLGGGAIGTYVDSLFNLIPAFLMILCEIPAFFGQKLLMAAYVSNRLGRVVGLGNEFFGVGLFTAVLWSVTFLLSFFGTPASNRFFAVTENLRYLLLPALCVVGARTVFVLYLCAKGGSRALFWLAGVALFCCSPATALSALAFFGVYDTVARALRRAAGRRLNDLSGGSGRDNNDNNNDNNDDNDDNDNDNNDENNGNG